MDDPIEVLKAQVEWARRAVAAGTISAEMVAPEADAIEVVLARLEKAERERDEAQKRAAAAQFSREAFDFVAARAERLREGLTRLIEACHRLSQSSDEFWQEVRAAEGLAEAQEVEARAEAAQDVGAHLMLDQMEKAVAGGGLFSDERANRFVAAEARAERLRELLGDALAVIYRLRPELKRHDDAFLQKRLEWIGPEVFDPKGTVRFVLAARAALSEEER